MPPLLRRLTTSAALLMFGLEATLYAAGIPKDYLPHSVPRQFQNTVAYPDRYTNARSTSIDFVYDRNPRGYFREGNVVQHVTNSSGFRGPEITLVPQPGTQRILFLGDSITFGEGVYFEDTYPERFKALASAVGLWGGNIEAVNMGVGGYDTVQELQLLEEAEQAQLSPARIIVGYNMNDADEPILHFENDVAIRKTTALEEYRESWKNPSPLFQMFRSLRIVRNWFADRAITEKTIEYYQGLYKDENPSWQATKEAFKQFAAFEERTGIPVTFVVFPRLFKLDEYPFVEQRQKVQKELAANGLDMVFIYPYLEGYKGPELWVHPTDQHPNEIVHNIAAQALLEHFSALTK